MSSSVKKSYPVLLVVLTFVSCFTLLEFGFISIDETSYFYLSKMMVETGGFAFDTDYDVLRSPLSRPFLGVVSGDSVYSAFPPGFPFLASPFYMLFGIEGMQIANIFFTVLLVITFYLFVRDYYHETDAFVASVILLLGTQILNYSVSLWSHISAALFILLSIRLLFRKRVILSGLAIGASVVVRYSALAIVPILIGYLYKKDRKAIPAFLISLFIGITPLLIYNQISFGSPFVSGMSVLNAEEGYHAVNLLQIPKGLITNLLHYTFFPGLELMPDKSSLLETSPFFAFAILGAYLFWKEKKKYRTEFYTMALSAIFFILFISGTWSLGGLAHNMRLLTDIVPLIAFFSLIPLFHLRVNYSRFFIATVVVTALLYVFGISFSWMKFYNLLISMTAIIVIFAVLILRKDMSSKPWKGFLIMLFALSIGMSVFTSVSVTNSEAATRGSVKSAAQAFEAAVPEGAVVFVYFGDYPMYTKRDYLFLDYSKGEEDIIRAIGYYKEQPIYVLIKTQENEEKFENLRLVPAGPIRTYTVSLE